MQTYTVADINKFNPCYDPTRHFDSDKEYTLLDFLDNETCPDEDKIWVVTNFLDDKTNRLFAVWCAREALKLVENTDPRSVEACNVAERFANGEASEEDLSAAREAAKGVAYATDRETAWASFVTADVVSRVAAWEAADYAAWEAALIIRNVRNACVSDWAAASDAAIAAARVAAIAAARVAGWDADNAAAWSSERKKQIEKLKEMIIANNR